MNRPGPVFHLALRDLHAASGAVFSTVSGWSVPMRYGDATAELAALRQGAAMFDRSSRSRFLVTGTDALEVLKAVFAGPVEELQEGRAMRAVALGPGGTIEDLALIARTGGIAYLVSGEPGRREATLARLRAAIEPNWDATVDDRTETTCLIGLAGPGAANVANEHLNEALPARLQALHCLAFEFHGFRGLAIRTSDTGEDGFEFMLAPAVAQHLVETLRAAGIPLAGQEALDIARVEACIPAFEPDLETGLSPAEAELDALLGIDGGPASRVLSAVLLEGPGVPATGTPLMAGGEPAGELRSCVRSPSLNATIGLGIIDSRHAFPGREILAGADRAVVVAKPFHRRRS
ncbi:MAG: aminomethyltransferase [Dehalococcoidia bacterium]